jgi:DNA polymerase-3 subunit epsilon
MRFIALDVETANSDMASICSIGIAGYEGAEIKVEYYTLIDPQDEFDGITSACMA